MKKTPKIHLIDVKEPLTSYSNLLMRCGRMLETAEQNFMVTPDFERWLKEAKAAADAGEETDARLQGMCTRCLRAEPEPTEERTWTYGLSEKVKK